MDWFIEAMNRVLAFFYSLVLTILDALYDMVCLVADKLLSVVNVLVSGVMASLSAIPIPDVIPLPSGVAWVASQVGVPQMIVIITGALIVRVTLQLIPFVRLGS
ncbi:hypothetical protein [Vibrio scophthalmi]|uniref:Uncharacterized protein n=1 Tax=Vibrio scophthalmi TaxID=45658 RepID=A0A1E3WFZ2_9VIBR|nr:hypothetical protein [Vibrio scophthalmi]ODS04738.1 hypothetical protein VSF3289_03877 [Vibrio scophthalmi]